MASRRMPRVNEQLKREITRVLRDEVKDPRIGFITLTDVDATRDLSLARVYVSVMGDEDEKSETLEGLNAAAAFIRGELGRRLHMRRIPELEFRLDRSLERAMRVREILDEVLPDDDGDAATAGDDEPAPDEPPTPDGPAGDETGRAG